MDEKELIRAINYYKRKVEELAGENLRYDNIVSHLKHELRKSSNGFALLTKLQKTFSDQDDVSSIFQLTLQAINETFTIEKSLTLIPDSVKNYYRPNQWEGFNSEEIEKFSGWSINFPEEYTSGEKILLVTRVTEPSPLIEELRSVFNLPFFICLPIKIENMPTTLLIAGRTKEAKPFFPPFNQSDVDTLQAVADLITATIHSRHFTVLKEMDRMKTEFFTNISHEFRTPLTLILGPVEKLIEKCKSEEELMRLSMIFNNAQKLLKLINQLLDLSKLDAGKLNLQASKANIIQFSKGITMSFESLAEQKDIELKFSAAVNDIEIYFESDKMAKILTNLLSNAFKFTGEGGKIEVRVNLSTLAREEVNALSETPSAGVNSAEGQNGITPQKYVSISIRDTGIGIADEELPKLFDRFYQVDSSHTREHEGTGIGLALTKELVELHHGLISVKSKKCDPGLANSGWTELTVSLPIGREHLGDDEISLQPEDDSESVWNNVKNLSLVESTIENNKQVLPNSLLITPDNGNEHLEEKNIVLIVEDNPDMRLYIRNSLCNKYRIEEASNGEQGVRKAVKIVPDLIVSDLMMPKMDGNELTRQIKNDERTSHIPVILLTAKSDQKNKLEGLETGADAYLIKPFDTKELQIRIKNLIDIRMKLQEKYSKVDFIEKHDTKKLSGLDEKFMSKVLEIIEANISEENFSIEYFSSEIGMSRVQLYRKLKALSGKSVSNYIKSVRLSKAKKMIEDRSGNISEIAYSVGFSSPQYFTRCFKEEFGHPPTYLVQN